MESTQTLFISSSYGPKVVGVSTTFSWARSANKEDIIHQLGDERPISAPQDVLPNGPSFSRGVKRRLNFQNIDA